MFNIPNIEKRILVYQFNYLIEQAIKIKNQVRIKKLLSEFEKTI